MARSKEHTPDKCTESGLECARLAEGELYNRCKTEPLSFSDEEHIKLLAQDKYVTGVVLLHGAPPPHPGNISLIEFGDYIHELGEWTSRAREQLFVFWSIDERIYEEFPIYRKAFDRCLEKWYSLKYEEIEGEQ